MKHTIEEVFQACKETVDLLEKSPKGTFLTRDTKTKDIDINLFDCDISYRKPLNTSQNLHDFLNSKYEAELGWPVRNGLFSYGVNSRNFNEHRNLGYGDTHILFPCDSIKYAFDKDIKDLTEFEYFFRRDNKGCTDREIADKVNYVSEGVENILNISVYENRSVEIMINCSKFYLLDLNYSEELIKRIWP